MPSSFSHFRGLSESLYNHLRDDLLAKWYPLVVDQKHGGYLTNLAHDWQLASEQEKMIVSQARHVWTTAKVAMFMPESSTYEAYARHGLRFLRKFMWDGRYGGFYQIRSREGGYSDCRGWGEEKRTYGNAFGIFALAALYGLTRDSAVLAFAKESFEWLETHAYDNECKGYHQFMTRQGEPFDETSQYRSVASDIREVGLKDYNASIHLLEAYTELLLVWNAEILRAKLTSLLELIRDTMVAKMGYLQLYFTRDWIPVTFRMASEATRTLNYGLDHVSFGNDIETAFLMLEASYTLGIRNDSRTLAVAKHMLDHAISSGWDRDLGGFFDAGYYLNGSDQCSIIRNSKTWWSQAEALNTLLMFSRIFPENSRYRELFEQQWSYIDKYLLDHRNGDWYERGIDNDPNVRYAPKSHMWKCTYHTVRAIMNSVALTSDEEHCSSEIRIRRQELDKMINHWRTNKLVTERKSTFTIDASS
jgi:mannobiose 2-epimerase